MSALPPGIAIAPMRDEAIEAVVEEAGGRLVPLADAEGLVWLVPGDPQGLSAALRESKARWVQLPFAGIEGFVSAGIITDERTWTCAKGVYGPACAEHAVALMLAAVRCFRTHLCATQWVERGPGSPERRLTGTSAVVIGAGGIGRALVPLLRAHGVAVSTVSRSGKRLEGVVRARRWTELDDALPGADWVVLAAALTPETRGLLGVRSMAAMDRDCWVVNVARGGLVDTDALVEALRNGTIGGAALDVTDPEPLPRGHPLWSFDNVLITPHIANTDDMGRPELIELIRRNVERFASGDELEGLVDPGLGY